MGRGRAGNLEPARTPVRAVCPPRNPRQGRAWRRHVCPPRPNSHTQPFKQAARQGWALTHRLAGSHELVRPVSKHMLGVLRWRPQADLTILVPQTLKPVQCHTNLCDSDAGAEGGMMPGRVRGRA